MRDAVRHLLLELRECGRAEVGRWFVQAYAAGNVDLLALCLACDVQELDRGYLLTPRTSPRPA